MFRIKRTLQAVINKSTPIRSLIRKQQYMTTHRNILYNNTNFKTNIPLFIAVTSTFAFLAVNKTKDLHCFGNALLYLCAGTSINIDASKYYTDNDYNYFKSKFEKNYDVYYNIYIKLKNYIIDEKYKYIPDEPFIGFIKEFFFGIRQPTFSRNPDYNIKLLKDLERKNLTEFLDRELKKTESGVFHGSYFVIDHYKIIVYFLMTICLKENDIKTLQNLTEIAFKSRYLGDYRDISIIQRNFDMIMELYNHYNFKSITNEYIFDNKLVYSHTILLDLTKDAYKSRNYKFIEFILKKVIDFPEMYDDNKNEFIEIIKQCDFLESKSEYIEKISNITDPRKEQKT